MRMYNVFDLVAIGFVVAMLWLSLVGTRRMRRDQLVFPVVGACLTTVIIDFPSNRPDLPVLLSATRLTLEIFPVFLMFARLIKPGPLRITLLCAGIVLQAAQFIGFVAAKWAG